MSSTRDERPASAGAVAEVLDEDSGPPRWVHPGWLEDHPGIEHGTTHVGPADGPQDFALFGEGPSGAVMRRWDDLRSGTSFREVVHARQVHGAAVRVHAAGVPGLRLVEPCDGHATAARGVLLTVATADCVPIFLAAPGARAVGLLHAGWRGVEAGVLERGVAVLGERFAVAPRDLVVHLGPAICGACYEVGPEVHEALGLPRPEEARPVDLRALLAARLAVSGVPRGSVTASSHCTRCGDARFFSHRGGDRFRQISFLGIRP